MRAPRPGKKPAALCGARSTPGPFCAVSSTQFRAAGCLILGTCLGFTQSVTGIHARANPADYAASQQTATGIYAASLVPRDQVKHIFATDISNTYLVFELACYPVRGGKMSIDPEDFLVRVGANPEFVHPADAATVASVIQQKNTPRPGSNTQAVYTSANVGYESGTDPYTGRRVHGVYTGAGVGVGPADAGPLPPPPGSMPQDRAMLETQLADKALPQGSFAAPTAGFLYFPAKEIKKKSGETYQIQYLSDPSGKVQLQIPVKSR